MKTPIEVEGREWFVTDQFLDNGGKVKAGPFSTEADVFAARRGMEELTGLANLYIDHRDPAPPVVLPEEGSWGLGWATWGGQWGRRLAVWETKGLDLVPSASTYTTRGKISALSAFTPATAVPTDALADLRVAARNANYTGSSRVALAYAREGLTDFLAAVDAAGSGDE